MKSTKHFKIMCFFLMSILFAGISLAHNPSFFDSTSSDSVLRAPKLTVAIDGMKVTLSWSNVTGAADYEVHYSQAPYDHPGTIKTINVGNKTSSVYNLFPGCSYHIAVRACDASGFNCGAYSNIHDVKIPIVSSFKNSLGQEFKLIPAGGFIMGAPIWEPGHSTVADETQHQVSLSQSYYMQTTEVTQAQWEAVMGDNPSHHSGCPNCPVEKVSWDDAQSYITKMNARGEGTYSLPTEAQWEYAARALSTTAFYNGYITKPEGNDPNLDAIGWYRDNSSYRTHPVAQKAANAWGLYDMSGNVSEYCQDWYDYYPSGPVIDPKGPSENPGWGRVTRGGNYMHPAGCCRSAWRYWFDKSDYVGFRLSRRAQ